MRRSGIALAVALLLTGVAFGQGPSAPMGNNGETAAAKGEEAVRSERTLVGDVPYLPVGPGEQFVPVPLDASLEEYLRWVAERRQARSAGPAYSMTSVALNGSADDERAALTAVVQVQVNRADEWVGVPLAFNEGTLLESKYKGDGEASFAGLETDAGYRWWLRGKGLHELTLSLSVPLRRQTPSRRLVLAVPPTAVSSLKLTAPLHQLTARVVPETVWTKTSNGRSGSEIEIRGFGTRLDVSWQPLPDLKRVETILQVHTLIESDLTSESVVLEALQTVQALQGSFTELTVRLPAGFELLDVEERDRQRYYANHTVDANDPQRVTVLLNEAITGPLRLKWTLEAAFPREGGRLTIEGFEVERARRQTGEVVIGSAEGYRVTKREGQERFVHRSNLNRPLTDGRMLSAYRFLQQPFRLVFDVREIEPYFTVKPLLTLRLSAEQAELTAVFQYQVDPDRGAVQELELNWPNRRAEGWTIEPLESPGLVERVEFGAEDDEDDAGRVRLRLASRRTGSFELPLKARRPIIAGGEAFPLSLPVAVAAHHPQTMLHVERSDNLEAELIPSGSTIARPLPAVAGEPDGPRDLGRLAYRIDSPRQTFAVRTAVHKQSVRADTTATVELHEDRLLVAQRIVYDIAWEPLAQLRLLVPQELEGRVSFTKEEIPLRPNSTSLEVGSMRQVRLVLPRPRIGRLEVTARYVLELKEGVRPGRDVPVALPLLQSSDAEFASVRMAVRQDEQLEANVSDKSWKRQPPLNGLAEWVGTGGRAEVPLVLSRSKIERGHDYVVRRALIRTAFDRDGYARSRARYRIEGPARVMTVRCPGSIEPEAFWWDREKLDEDHVRETSPGSGEFRIELPPASADAAPPAHLLTIDFHSREPSPFEWGGTHRLAAPQLPADLWVEQTVWDVMLPFDQHLFTRPDGFLPLFRWERGTIFWSRRPLPAFENPITWVLEEEGPPLRSTLLQGNAYLFTRFGPTDSIVFQSMGRSMIVLLGAGLALAGGVVLLKIPATRHVTTLLAAAFGVALVAVWQAEPVQVLLQPAVLGLLLALVAAFIESSLKREKAPAVLTVPASDFIPPSSGGSSYQYQSFGVGSEDLTAVRTPAMRVEDPVPSSDTGSRR